METPEMKIRIPNSHTRRPAARFFVLLSLNLGPAALPALPHSLARQIREPWSDAKLDSIPNFVLNARYQDRRAYPLPASVDNSKSPFAPPFADWDVQGNSCGSSSAGYLYGFEAQQALNLPSGGKTAQYTYEYPYHFLNRGNQADSGDAYMFVEAFDIFKATGLATSADFGGFEWGNAFGAWMSGYDKYYRAMKLRAEQYYKIDANQTAGKEMIKQYLTDKGELSGAGGMLSFNVGNWTTKTAGGRTVLTAMNGEGVHAMNIVGYDDAIEGGSYQVFDGLRAILWMPYAVLGPDRGTNASRGTPVMFCRMKKDYSPRLALKITLTHTQRGDIALRTGFANGVGAAVPAQVRDYAGAFNYSGGRFPMIGKGQGATIEIGLDLTDFVPSLTGPSATFFLRVDSKGGSGQIDKVTLMDYTGATVKELPAAETNKAIVAGTATTPATTLVGISWTGSAGVRNRFERARAGRGESILVYRHEGPVRLRLGIEAATAATLTVLDVHGRSVYAASMALDASSRKAGFPWELKNLQGERVNPGLYFAYLELAKGGESLRTSVIKIQVMR